MAKDDHAIEESAEPPVVARLVIEIRSDGKRTIARGALQDAALGQEVVVKAEGTTPLSLAVALVRSLVSAPILRRAVSRALLAARSGRSERPLSPPPADPNRSQV
jgi:hypothetical protein